MGAAPALRGLTGNGSSRASRSSSPAFGGADFRPTLATLGEDEGSGWMGLTFLALLAALGPVALRGRTMRLR